MPRFDVHRRALYGVQLHGNSFSSDAHNALLKKRVRFEDLQQHCEGSDNERRSKFFMHPTETKLQFSRLAGVAIRSTRPTQKHRRITQHNQNCARYHASQNYHCTIFENEFGATFAFIDFSSSLSSLPRGLFLFLFSYLFLSYLCSYVDMLVCTSVGLQV